MNEENKKKVLNKIKEIAREKNGDIDFMEGLTASTLEMSESEFAESLKSLQNDGKISGVHFCEGKLTLYDSLSIYDDDISLH